MPQQQQQQPQPQQQSAIDVLLKPYLDPQRLIRKYEALKNQRKTWDAEWDLIQRQVFPDYRDYKGDPNNTSQPLTHNIKNATCVVSGLINKIVALLNSQVCDPTVQWLDLKFAEDQFNDVYETRAWLNQCKDKLYKTFSNPQSHFYTSTLPFHMDWFTIGTACREVIVRRDNGQIQFLTVPMSDVFIELSGYGDVATVCRRMNLTAKQAVDLWGESLSPRMIENAQKDDAAYIDRKYEFFETVMRNPLKDQLPSLDWLSVVVDKQNKNICDIGLHAYSPYIVSRFFVTPGETYGRSYVWNAMPTISAINRLNIRELQSIDFATLPVYMVKDENAIPRGQLTPGSFIQGLDSNGRPKFQQLPMPSNTQLLIEFLKMLLQELEDCLVAKDVIPFDSPNMTATEVDMRNIQSNNRIRPLIIRLENEDLNFTVLRTLKLLEQQGQLPPFPYEDLGIQPDQLPDPIGALRVNFSGRMAKMQRQQDISDMDQLLQKTMQVAQIDPTVMDRINVDQIIAEQAKIMGVSPSVLNSDKIVQQTREARAKAQEQEQEQQQQAALLDNLVKLKDAGVYSGNEAA